MAPRIRVDKSNSDPLLRRRIVRDTQKEESNELYEQIHQHDQARLSGMDEKIPRLKATAKATTKADKPHPTGAPKNTLNPSGTSSGGNMFLWIGICGAVVALITVLVVVLLCCSGGGGGSSSSVPKGSKPHGKTTKSSKSKKSGKKSVKKSGKKSKAKSLKSKSNKSKK